MHCLRAAVALVAVMTFSLTALGQTPRAAKVGAIRRTGGGMAPASQPFDARIHDKITRYQKTPIYGLTEYNPDNCMGIDIGMWSPPTDLNPSMSGTIDSTTNLQGKLDNGDCPNTTFTFAVIQFTWTAHNNKTAIPSLGCPLDQSTTCPVAVFSSIWTTKDHCCDVQDEFDISVPVVRPKGETSTLEKWQDSMGIWKVTLMPPSDDSTFDFTGETVNEVFLSDQNSCPGNASVDPSMGVVNSGPPGSFHDLIGFDPCVVHYARCLKKPGFWFVIKQQMEINSQQILLTHFFLMGLRQIL
jgi:hypothetical protein